MKNYLIILLLIALSISACAAESAQGTEETGNQAPGAQEPADSASLIGSWKLTAYGPASAPTPAVESAAAGLTFNPDGTVTGTSGCNGLGGDYSVEGDQITFGEFVSTLMACDDPIMKQEEAAHKVMAGTATYKIEGDTLTITKNDMVLVLTRGSFVTEEPAGQDSLTGAWKLVSFRESDVLSLALADVEAGLTFNEDGTLTGTAGCNELGGSYTVEGDQIAFKEIVSTLMLCDTPLMEQEEAMQLVLANTATYEIDGNTLTITNGDRALILER